MRLRIRPRGALNIRFFLDGCRNRPFYHIVVSRSDVASVTEGIEQIGSYEPMVNERGEKLLALNIERFQYWIMKGAEPNTSVASLLGLAGIWPFHPHMLTLAWRKRRWLLAQKAKAASPKIEETN